MKKILISVLFMLLFVTGCTSIYVNDCNHSTTTTTTTQSTTTTQKPVAQGDLKTGLAIISSVKESSGQTAKFTIDVAVVTVDENGVIVACKFDTVDTKIEFNTNGEVTTDLTTAVKSKHELGDAYNMVTYGGAIAEWYEQANSFAAYCVGKTVDQVKGIAVDANTKPTGSDLTSSVTIKVGTYQAVIVKAVENAKNLGAKATDSLHMAVNASMTDSKNATTDKKGAAQLNVDVTAVTENNGVITSCAIDSVQAKVEFDQTGTITTDLTAQIKTKHELGDAYGMVAWGGAIAEWNVQTESFCEYVKGKTAEQVANIAVNESTKPTGSDLSSSVTIAIGGFQALIAEALK